MSNPVVYYRNAHFASLVDPPNEPQPLTLAQEIRDSDIETELAFINTNEVGYPPTDIEVQIYFVSEPSTEDVAILDDIVADHEGRPTTKNAQLVESSDESVTDSSDWQDKIDFTAQPMAAGFYQLCVALEVTVDKGSDGSEPKRRVDVQMLVDGVERALSCWHVAVWHMLSFTGAATVKEGYTPRFQIQFRKGGDANDTARVRRARMCITKVHTED